MFVCNKSVRKISHEIIEMYKKVCPSTIGHMTDYGFIKELRPIQQDFHFAGTAVTVKIPHMDGTAIHKSFDMVEEGDVVVIDTSGDYERAPVGEIVAYAYLHKKAAAVIIDGCVTDVRAVRQMPMPVFCRSVSPLTTRRIGIEGAINIPVSICGVVVNPGDLVVGDDDGIFVVSPELAEEYGEKAIAKQNGEPALKKRIDNGERLSDINGCNKYFGI